MILIFEYIWQSLKRVYHRTFSFDENAEQKCPNCGLVGPKPMKWMIQFRANMFQCPRCDANWGKDPVVPIDKWHVADIEQIMTDKAVEEDQRIAAREKAAGIKR